ncbi:MAG: hypothetical protein AB1467_02135 [Candidatus Diapherotrites archaeon]
MRIFENEEIKFWLKTARKYAGKKDKIIEIGCGGGRILKELMKAGFNASGFDNNILFVNHCKKHSLNVFYLDATKKAPKKHKFKYKIAGIALNTLFNFQEKTRKKWALHACNLLEKDGLLIINAYSDNNFSRKNIGERIKFYEAVLAPPKNYYVEFFDNGRERGIRLCNPNGKEKFFSRWITRNELVKEIKTWKCFKIKLIKLMKCRIGRNVLLAKK